MAGKQGKGVMDIGRPIPPLGMLAKPQKILSALACLFYPVTLLQILCQSIHYNKAFWFLIPVLLRARQLWEPQRGSSTNRNHCKQFQEIPDFPVLLWPWRNTDQCHFEQNLPPQRSPLHFPLAYAHVHWWMSDYHPGKDQPVCFCSFCLAVEYKYLAQTVARY